MGTNYFVEHVDCPVGMTMPDHHRRLHIGKSSCGWCFGLHAIPELGLMSWIAWQTHLRLHSSCPITDEYGCHIALSKFRGVVLQRGSHASSRGDVPDPLWFMQNHAVPGPMGLVRSAVDGCHCLAHGRGAWDLIAGDFS